MATSVLLAFLFSSLFGRTFSSRLSMMPIIGKIVGPPAPVVITTREVINSSSPQDFANVTDSVKTKLSTVVAAQGNQVTVAGGAVNITSDGLFAAPAEEFALANGKYSVLLSDGRLASVSQTSSDLRGGLIFFRAAIQNVPVISLDDSGSLNPGNQLEVLFNSTRSYLTRVFLTQVSQAQGDVEHEQFSADKSSRSFTVQSGSPGLGSAIIDEQGNLVGLWAGSGIISSDVLQQGIQKYLADGGNFAEPQFGFSYTMVTKVDSRLLNLPEGAQVTAILKTVRGVAVASPALAAKLQTGDIITQINGSTVNEQNLAEIILEQAKPGDQVLLTLMRGKDTIKLQLTAGKE